MPSFGSWPSIPVVWSWEDADVWEGGAGGETFPLFLRLLQQLTIHTCGLELRRRWCLRGRGWQVYPPSLSPPPAAADHSYLWSREDADVWEGGAGGETFPLFLRLLQQLTIHTCGLELRRRWCLRGRGWRGDLPSLSPPPAGADYPYLWSRQKRRWCLRGQGWRGDPPSLSPPPAGASWPSIPVV